MADKTVSERLQPSLLDRLTDDEPGSRKEARDSRVVDVARLREIIQRDLSWLLNTDSKEDLIDAERFPNVTRSVLNYGIGATAGEFSTIDKADRIRRSISRAIERFEPRIVAGSVLVRLRTEESSGEMHISFDIQADMWAQPMPLELYLRSRVDLSTGEIDLERGR